MNVQGLSRARILKALYNNTTVIAPVARITGEARPTPMTTDEAEGVILGRAEGGYDLYFDYLFGRMVKTNLEGDVLDLRLYDRDNGPGAGERAILEEFTAPG